MVILHLLPRYHLLEAELIGIKDLRVVFKKDKIREEDQITGILNNQGRKHKISNNQERKHKPYQEDRIFKGDKNCREAYRTRENESCNLEKESSNLENNRRLDFMRDNNSRRLLYGIGIKWSS